MTNAFELAESLRELRERHRRIDELSRLPYFFGCRLKILVVADRFLYFNDENFGLSELVSTLRGMSTVFYPVTVDLAHRNDPGASRLNGATANFTFEYDELKRYHQLWIMAAETRAAAPITNHERQAIRRFMDEGGGVFATGDHEDLGVSVGGYIPRVRSMRKWFWPAPGPNGEPVAPHGTDSTRHDTNRSGHDADFSFNDQSDDVPQTIAPHYFGSFVQSVHPVLCTPEGPIDILPDHPHEGECITPADIGADYQIEDDTFREYPDGPFGTPLAPLVIATSTMIPGAEVPELGKPPVPGGTFGAIGAWDGHRAGDYGRIVVDATWHHFININLIGTRSLGPPDPAVPKSMGFLHSAAGMAHYERVKDYYRNIADWLTPRSMRRCFLHRRIWWATSQGWFQENYRARDLVANGHLAFEILRWPGPCERYNFLVDLILPELQLPFRPLVDPFAERTDELEKLLATANRDDARTIARDVPAAFMGAAVDAFLELDVSVERLQKEFGDEEAEVPEFVKAVDKAAEIGLKEVGMELERQAKLRSTLLATLR